MHRQATFNNNLPYLVGMAIYGISIYSTQVAINIELATGLVCQNKMENKEG